MLDNEVTVSVCFNMYKKELDVLLELTKVYNLAPSDVVGRLIMAKEYLTKEDEHEKFD